MTYIQYLRMLRWLFTCLSCFVAIPLALANYYLNSGGTIDTTSAKDIASTAASQVAENGAQNVTDLLDNLQLFTAAGITGNALWVHIGFEWVISSLVLAFGECTSGLAYISDRSFVVSWTAATFLG